MELNTINSQSTWGKEVDNLNKNFQKVDDEMTKLQNATYKNKGYFSTVEKLKEAFPNATVGSKAYVGTSYPYAIWVWIDGVWTDSGKTGGEESLNLNEYIKEEDAINQFSNKAETDEKLTELASEINFSIENDGEGKGLYWALSGTSVGEVHVFDSDEYRCSKAIHVLRGDTFNLTTLGASIARAYAFTDLNRVIVEVAEENAELNNKDITAPSDGFLFVNCRKSYYDKFKCTKYYTPESLAEARAEIEKINFDIHGVAENIEAIQVLSNSAISTSGVVVGVSGTDYKVYEYDVEIGEKYQIYNKTISVGSNKRLSIAAYNEKDELVDTIATWPTSGTITDDEDLKKLVVYVVPEGVVKIRLGNYKSSENYIKKIVIDGLYQKNIELSEKAENNEIRSTNNEFRIEQYEKEVTEIKTKIDGKLEYVEPTSILSSSVINTSGTITSVSGTGYKVYEYPVIEGNTYEFYNKTSNVGSSKRLSIAAYNELGELVEAISSWPTSNSIGDDNLIRKIDYKVPSGISVIKMGNLSGEQHVGLIITEGLIRNIANIEDDVAKHELRIKDIEENAVIITPKIFNPINDLHKDELRVLHIGNSFMNGSLVYLKDLINAAAIDVSNMCLYTCYRGGGSFKSWVDCWHDLDTESYSVNKQIGGIEQNISGSSSANNGEKFRNTIINNKWDYIIIQQASAYANDYSAWETESNGGYLVELIRLLKTYQPQATIGYNMVHSSPRDNYDMLVGFNNIANAAKKLKANYGIDFIIPYGTAIQNIRLSSIATGTSKGFCKDGHHLARGVGNYVASATYFQALFAPRYGVSILGNSFRVEVTSEDLSDVTYPSDVISVTDENVNQCQMAAILACCNMWDAVNPDNIAL